MVASNEHVPGNLEVVETIRQCLLEAEKGKIGYCVCILADGQQFSIGVSGNINLEPVIEQGLSKALDEIIKPAQENRKSPNFDETLDKSYVVYNLATGPASFDFIAWLVDREMERIEANAPSPLKVAIWLGKDGKVGINSPLRSQMYQGVIKPAVALIGGILDDKALNGHRKELYTVRGIEEKSKAGQQVPKLHAPENAHKAIQRWLNGIENPVSITLREYVEWPHRNSTISEWLKFADYLKTKGYTPIILRDTTKAHEGPISDHLECPQASLNLHMRMALYEQCKANLFVSNGPSALALFTDVPWLMYHSTEQNGAIYAPATPQFVREFMGIDLEKGEQQNWCNPKQKIIQANDTYENLVKYWEEVIEA